MDRKHMITKNEPTAMTDDEKAALVLLRSLGTSMVEVVQVVCAALHAGRGSAARALQCIEAGAVELKKREHTVSLSEAAWASVAARSELRPTTRRDLRHFVRRMLRVEGAAEKPLRAVTTQECQSILEAAFRRSRNSFRKGRAILHSIFAYGIRREWCDTNPVGRIEVPKVQERMIVPLTLNEVERLKKTALKPAFRDMRFSLLLMLYGGIRPAEVSRLSHRDVDWEGKEVIIRPQTSKTGGGRAVPLRGMQGIRMRECCIPRNWQRKWKALRRAAGFTGWIPDICRHTFACYYTAYFRNLSELQLEMGHRDVTLLRTRYTIPVSRRVAAAYWKRAGCGKENTGDCVSFIEAE